MKMSTSTLFWSPLPRLPVFDSTAATLCGKLVSIGGTKVGLSESSILQLMGGLWVRVGSMSTGRHLCLAISMSPDELVVVGGHYSSIDFNSDLDSVEC